MWRIFAKKISICHVVHTCFDVSIPREEPQSALETPETTVTAP